MHQNNLIPSGAAAVTASDSTFVNFVGLYVGGAGDVTVKGGDGNNITFSSVPAGTIIPMQVIQVRATSTTATSIVGFVA